MGGISLPLVRKGEHVCSNVALLLSLVCPLGIELFLGGIGADGHIAFNEPGHPSFIRSSSSSISSS